MTSGLVVALAAGMACAAAGEATVSLAAPGTTSAGVYDRDGRLVRTLWRGRPHNGGVLSLSWDGRDDDGQAVPEKGIYQARVLSHDVRYVWEGVIGNTSAASVGSSVHRAFHPIHDMAIDADGNAFYAVGYNEGQNALHRFHVSNPQVRTQLAREDYRRVFRHAATDGNLAYFANVGLRGARGSAQRRPETFVIALRVADGKEHRFAAGRPVFDPAFPGDRWTSAIDYDAEDSDDGKSYRLAPAGLAVQRAGNLLFVSHPGAGEIRLFDKRSGEPRGHIAIDGAHDLQVGPDDALWVLSRGGSRAAVQCMRQLKGEWRQVAHITAGLDDPVALGISPDGSVVVADAGSEQLKAFDPSGRPLWTLGRAGGYRDGGPDVTPECFRLSAGPTYVAFQADGSFWVGDPGNFRNLHFSVRREFLEQIMFLPASYVSCVDPGRPSRVFSGYLEFEVDYGKPLAASWTLVRNWAAGAGEMPRDGLRMVRTLANGRTYGLAPASRAGGRALVELAGTGLRYTGIVLDSGVRLYPDGSLRTHRVRFGELTVSERRLMGFDAEGNPRWDPWTAIASASARDDLDPHPHRVPLVAIANEAVFPESANGIVTVFNAGKSGGFHLGGIRRNDAGWLWRTSPAGTWQLDHAGMVVAADGSYETGRGVHYPGSIVTAAGRNIVFGYHGEAWNGGQANQWLHLQDDGMFVGQFGVPAYAHANRIEVRAGVAGNAFSPSLVEVAGQTYLWHNDESVHAGVHRWRIAGLDTIRRVSTPISP